MRELMSKLKLTVNEEKTRICTVPEGEFDFLGYTFGRMYSARTGQARLGYRPSKKSIKRVIERVHALTAEAMAWQEVTALVGKLNRTLRMGELLPSRYRQQSVSGDRQLHDDAAEPVVAPQAQGQTQRVRALSSLAPLRDHGSRASISLGARRVVGEGVKSCPRAGCGKSARPVR